MTNTRCRHHYLKARLTHRRSRQLKHPLAYHLSLVMGHRTLEGIIERFSLPSTVNQMD